MVSVGGSWLWQQRMQELLRELLRDLWHPPRWEQYHEHEEPLIFFDVFAVFLSKYWGWGEPNHSLLLMGSNQLINRHKAKCEPKSITNQKSWAFSVSLRFELTHSALQKTEKQKFFYSDSQPPQKVSRTEATIVHAPVFYALVVSSQKTLDFAFCSVLPHRKNTWEVPGSCTAFMLSADTL